MLKLAYCGNDCNDCPRYIATQSGNIERLKEVAALWERLGWRDTVVSSEEMVCHGCSSANWCRYGVRECGLERGVDNCGECESYPCDKVLGMFERAKSHAENVKRECSKEDYNTFLELPFQKKENLDRVKGERC